MDNRRKFLVASAATLGALALNACSPKAAAPSLPAAPARVMAVLIYADWCASCKVLEPKLKAVKPDFEGKGIVFSRLDYTSKDTEDLYAQARAMGIEEAFRSAVPEPIKTGQLLLMPIDQGKILGRVNMVHSPEDITQRFNRALTATKPNSPTNG